MILQEKIIEITEVEILIYIIVVIIAIFIWLLIFLYIFISNKLHREYHKGYNKAKDDKVQYYKTIKEIVDSFNEIFSELTKEGSNNMYKAHTLELLIDFKSSLQNYYNN